MTKYNKLVRDRIPEIVAAKGGEAKWHTADEVEYEKKLLEKLQEEVNEFLADESIGEIADVMEVLEAICELKQFTPQQVLAVKDKKAAERGKFSKKIILEES